MSKEKKKYIVQRFAESPFDKSECSKNYLHLSDLKGKLIAMVLGSDRVKEGDILEEDQFEINNVSKKSKHLVVGDIVWFRNDDNDGHVFSGEISEIKENEEFWDEELVLINCKNTSELSFHRHLKCSPTNTVRRENAEAKEWPQANIKCPCCKRF